MNNNTSYETQAIDLSLLSVLDITKEGKVVSVEKWVELWTLVFQHINKIDAFCVDMQATLDNWHASEVALNEIIEDMQMKYASLSTGFTHYGEAPPQNPHIKFWVRRMDDIATHCFITNADIDILFNPESPNAQSGKAVAEAVYKVTNSLQAVNISFDKSNIGLKSENVQDAIDEIAIKVVGMAKVESWADVQNIVNLGMAQNVFKVGEQLECGHTRYGTLVWDITDVAPEKLSLCTHKCPVSLQFDAREALYYAETELAAGTYNFTIVTQPWYTADNGKTFQFTLTKPVPQGGQIVLVMDYNATLAGKSVKTYSGGDSTTVIETATITEGSEGTAFGKSDGSVVNLNHIQRAIMGSNNYKESALRQWLNSNGAAGTFWTPQTVFDRPPLWETNTAGFIKGLDADFLAVVSDTTYDVGLNNVTDGGGKETLTDKFVLLSRDEIYAGSEGGVTQGEPLPYFSEFSDHNSLATEADSNRIKTNASGKATYWWLRSPNTSYASPVRLVSPSGYLNIRGADNSCGVALACNIIKNQ